MFKFLLHFMWEGAFFARNCPPPPFKKCESNSKLQWPWSHKGGHFPSSASNQWHLRTEQKRSFPHGDWGVVLLASLEGLDGTSRLYVMAARKQHPPPPTPGPPTFSSSAEYSFWLFKEGGVWNHLEILLGTRQVWVPCSQIFSHIIGRNTACFREPSRKLY